MVTSLATASPRAYMVTNFNLAIGRSVSTKSSGLDKLNSWTQAPGLSWCECLPSCGPNGGILAPGTREGQYGLGRSNSRDCQAWQRDVPVGPSHFMYGL